MRPVTVTVTGVAASAPIPMDDYQNPFNVGFGVKVTGTITYNVEHTFDNVFDTTVSPTWFQNATVTAKTANADGNYAFAVKAIRLNATVGTGTATLTVIQSGASGG